MSEGAPAGRTCPWCSAAASDDATTCSSCGAALAQRESIGDLQIAGLTSVDPALAAVADRPIHLGGPSASHGVADAAIGAVAIGGPAGLAILGGIAAVAAAEYVGAKRPGAASIDLADVGRPSEVALRALERLGSEGEVPLVEGADAEPAPAPDPAPDPWRDLPPEAPTGA